MVRPAAIVVIASLLAAGAGVARADDSARARADERARRGYDLAQSGKPEEAIGEFKQALAIHQRAVYLCNIGLAYSELGKLHRAHWFLDQCVERWSETEDKPIDPRIAGHLAETAQKLSRGPNGRVRIKVEPETAHIAIPTVFAADEPVRSRRTFWLPVGRHTMRITSDGFAAAEVTVWVERGQQRALDLALEPTHRVAFASASSVGSRPDLTDTPPPSEPASPPGLQAPVTVLAIGVAAVVAGGVSHAVALNRRTEAADLPPGPAFDDADASYHRWRITAYGLYAAGAVTAGIGTVWLIARRRERARAPALSASAGPDHAVALAEWRF